jgi:hypothetical protein
MYAGLQLFVFRKNFRVYWGYSRRDVGTRDAFPPNSKGLRSYPRPLLETSHRCRNGTLRYVEGTPAGRNTLATNVDASKEVYTKSYIFEKSAATTRRGDGGAG